MLRVAPPPPSQHLTTLLIESRNTEPGGYLEMQDSHFPIQGQGDRWNPECALYQWSAQIVQGLGVFQRELAAAKYKQYMEEAGYVDVKEVQYIWPQNTWPQDPKLKELGRWMLVNSLDGLEGYSLAILTRGLGMSAAEVQVFLADVRRDMKDRRIHAYWPMYFVYGRKPLDAA